MHRTTFWIIIQGLIGLSLLWSATQQAPRVEQAGWIWSCGGIGSRLAWRPVRCRQSRRACLARRCAGCGRAGWEVALLRSLLLWGLWQASGGVGSDWWQLLPWLSWLLAGRPSEWAGLRRGVWQLQRALILGYLGLSGWQLVQQLGQALSGVGLLGLSCIVCAGERPQVSVEQLQDGSHQVVLCGHFRLNVKGDHPFRMRLLAIFLALLEVPEQTRQSRRTRDGRTPWIRQEQLAGWFERPQENISLWMKYWLQGDWAHLLSLWTGEVLTVEVVQRIVQVCAAFPHWNAAQVHAHVRQQGLQVSQAQVEQASQESGWQQVQATLRERFDLKAGFRLRDEWLVEQLLRQVQTLLVKVEAAGGLPPEERWAVADLQTLATLAGVLAEAPLPAQPWLQTLEGRLLGSWEPASQTPIRCPYCGSGDVASKSKKPRPKKFYDAQGQLQTVAVYRYYCHNPHCGKQSFTHLPAGLLPYSPYRTQTHLLALQMYAWGYSTYRRTGTALGLYSMTIWRWVSAWGHDLLPMAALFGVVKSSGVIGVDEKYVLVPKNDKPAGDLRRWMYVYLAVDAWTYDLLHIAIYPHNNEDSAQAFLLALRAKGYHPQVIVTDLRSDYGPLIAQVFPTAVHHECIFHALQNLHKHLKDVYGPPSAQQPPAAERLKQQLDALFDTHSPDEAHTRYQAVLQLKPAYLEATPAARVIFDFLERHWPKLVNAIGNDNIPATNNITELVIRRFDQHYQNFCGFESIESAQTYLAVFEKLYRFTPFSQDAQPRIRGQSPLQLAGYDVSQIPMSIICAGLSIDWPTEVNLVPS